MLFITVLLHRCNLRWNCCGFVYYYYSIKFGNKQRSQVRLCIQRLQHVAQNTLFYWRKSSFLGAFLNFLVSQKHVVADDTAFIFIRTSWLLFWLADLPFFFFYLSNKTLLFPILFSNNVTFGLTLSLIPIWISYTYHIIWSMKEPHHVLEVTTTPHPIDLPILYILTALSKKALD